MTIIFGNSRFVVPLNSDCSPVASCRYKLVFFKLFKIWYLPTKKYIKYLKMRVLSTYIFKFEKSYFE